MTDYDDLTQWLPLLTLNQDILSQRLVAHAIAQSWGLRGLAWTLELLDDELCDAWRCGSGLADLPRRHIEIAAGVLNVGVLQARFWTGELSLSSLVTDESRSDLIKEGRARWPELGAVPGEIALLALVLTGHPLTPRGHWRQLLDGPPQVTTRV